MTTGQVLRAIERRLRHHPQVGPSVLRFEERLRTCRLVVDAQWRNHLTRELGACRTPEEFLSFARATLTPGQKDTEILRLAAFARERAPRVFCEIGTLYGGTHFFLSHAVPSLELTLGIDLLVRHKTTLRFLKKPGQRSFFRDDCSTSMPTLRWVARTLAGRPIDLLFIDGDHSDDGVRADFLAYRRFVRDGGLIAFHDICEDYRRRFGLQTEHYAGGVPALWKALRPHYEHHEFVESPEQDGFGIGVLVYAKDRPLPRDL